MVCSSLQNAGRDVVPIESIQSGSRTDGGEGLWCLSPWKDRGRFLRQGEQFNGAAHKGDALHGGMGRAFWRGHDSRALSFVVGQERPDVSKFISQGRLHEEFGAFSELVFSRFRGEGQNHGIFTPHQLPPKFLNDTAIAVYMDTSVRMPGT